MDYSKIGFKCGLEIHQRLLTKEKLFCSCSAIESGKKIGEILRKQRAVSSELGEMDKAALEEQEKDLEYIYEIYDKSTCLVELDEEPPHEMNREALEIAIKLALLFNAKIVDEVHIMRKEVIDGSNTSGFQRTALIAYNGSVEVGNKKIPLETFFLEEESAGIVAQDSRKKVFRLDRLGIPLIEIDTSPVITSPKEAKEVAKRIGYALRVTGLVQRGIGTIRQDVNVSISEGARVEIKGLQEIEDVEEVIENEITRQLSLIQIKKELNEKKCKIGEEKRIEDILNGTSSKIIQKNLGIAIALKLENFKGILGKKIVKEKTFGKEISEYCGVGIMHSDENLEKYGLEKERIEEIKKRLKINENDSFLFVFGDKNKVEKAIQKIKERLEIAFKYIPGETRGVSKDLTTFFLRPLPGKARMYPETDLLPIPTSEILNKINLRDIKKIEEIENQLFNELGDKEKVKEILYSKDFFLYEKLKKISSPKIAFSTVQKIKSLRRKGIEVEESNVEKVLELYSKGSICKQAIEFLLEKKKIEIDEKIRRMNKEEIKEKVRELLEKGLGEKEIINSIMSKYRLRVESEDLFEVLRELKNKKY
ncbi:MAG: Glu-tRNA(Gln) amidotransferase subunit GatE [Candidatus Micrarchaeia archaeon]|jgi:glutamyl-tRNA(Gln) amidotransferase subunit E